MPELPEVETVRRGLTPVLVGQRLSRVVTYRPDLRVALPEGLAQRLTGRRVVALGRRAKYLLWHGDDGTVLSWTRLRARSIACPPCSALARPASEV